MTSLIQTTGHRLAALAATKTFISKNNKCLNERSSVDCRLSIIPCLLIVIGLILVWFPEVKKYIHTTVFMVQFLLIGLVMLFGSVPL